MKIDGILSWIDRGPFTSQDLGIYRIIYAAISLLTLNQFSWLADLPSSFFTPLPGPFSLASGFPNATALIVIELVLAVSLVALLIGFATPVSSLLVFATTLLGEGFSYSTGKIDHSILLTIVPLIMSFSGWGNSFSVDGHIRPALRLRPIRQWLMRLLAVSIGTAMLTAGLPKLYNGWLDPGTPATFGYQAIEYYTHERQGGLASFLVNLDAPWVWEIIDWATVGLECGLLLAAISWRTWRIGLALFTTFHLGVWLALNIPFWNNIVAYGAFVSWGALLMRNWSGRRNKPETENITKRKQILVAVSAGAVSGVGGVAAWYISGSVGQDRMLIIAPTLVVVGFAVGVGYLLRQVLLRLRFQDRAL